jgi:NarL family two-component system response regulator LiaR
LIADDHAIVRKGIRALLTTVADIEVIGEAQDGQEAIEEVDRLRPDVVLMDLVMPHVDGLEATRRIMEGQPEVRVLVLTSFSSDQQVLSAVKAGALGYLLKDASPGELVRSIRQVHGGEASLDPGVARKLLQEISQPSGWEGEPGSLTEREVEVLQLLASGMSNRLISERLEIGEATVRSHVSSILAKLKLDNRTQAALYALREGLASLSDPDRS